MKRHVIAAWAESAAGPGWANSPVWYLVRDEAGKLSVEALQPSEQSAEIGALYAVSQAAHVAMTRAVRVRLEKRRGKR